MRRVLVLRPEPGASDTLTRAQAAGLDAAAVPLFRIEPVAWEAPKPAEFDAILLTSANAVRQAGDQLRPLRALPAYAVGEATAAEARNAGFAVAATGDDSVDRLLHSLSPELRLLHLCGEDRREPSSAPQQIRAIAVYRASEVREPALGELSDVVALIHSPRAGRRFAELTPERSSIMIAAISPAAAEATGEGWRSVEAAEQPTDDAMLALAARLCNKPPL